MMDFEPFLPNITFRGSSFSAYSIEFDGRLDGSSYTATYVTEKTWNNMESSNDLEPAQSLFYDRGGVNLLDAVDNTEKTWNMVELFNDIESPKSLFDDHEGANLFGVADNTETRWINAELSNDLESAQCLFDNQDGDDPFCVVDNRYNRNNDENHGTMKDSSDVMDESDEWWRDLFGTDQYEQRVVFPKKEEDTSLAELGNFKTSDLPEKEKAASNSSSDVSGKIRKSSKSRRNRTSTNIIKWVYDLLCKGDPCIRWVNPDKLELLIVDQHRLATLWGIHKGNAKMNYNKFARTMRYHYERSKHKELVDISKKCKHKKKLVYQISPNAPFLQDDEPKHYK